MWTKIVNVAIQGVFEMTFVLGTPMATLLGGWLVLDHKKEWNAINQHTQPFSVPATAPFVVSTPFEQRPAPGALLDC